jgi:hypothetical protein
MHSRNSDVTEAVVRSLCERIDSPRALAVWLCFKHNQDALVELPMPAIAVEDSAQFQLDYFITEYLSKYKGLKLSTNKRKVALDKWKLTEVQCKETNARFRELQLRPFTGRVEGAIFGAQRKIAAVLGRLRRSIVLDGCKWGPGATFDMRREVATPDKKMSQPISVTDSALRYIKTVVECDPHWAYCFLGVIPSGPFSLLRNCFSIVKGSRFLTVPKSAKTDRCIAAEPTGNGFLQQAVHQYMRRRLKRFGVDLDDQSINQRRARDAYFQGLSTLDLSAASDTISRELVFHLLPFEWAAFLDELRSPETKVDGAWIRTEKFASMGNAFCFELETLIFWALASSVAESLGFVDGVTVYGDDLIVPREAYDGVVEILAACGFTVNLKKSYKDGNFFESCGKHYHKGFEVTPVYQKELLNHPSEIIRAHNRLVRLTARLLNTDSFDVCTKATRLLRNAYQLRPFPRIPFGVVEDGGFLSPLADFQPDKNHGFRCHVLDYVPRLSGSREDAMYAYKLRRFNRLNPDVKGYAGNSTKGTWRTRVRYIPECEAYLPIISLDPKVLLGLP